MKSPEKIKMEPEVVIMPDNIINLTVGSQRFTLSRIEAIDIINHLSGVLLVSERRCEKSEKKYCNDLRQKKGGGIRSFLGIRGKGSE